jgi:PAS domain S-box-containing protein
VADRDRADAEDVFAFIAEHTSDVIVRFSMTGTVTYVSPAVRRYGYEPSDLIGTAGDAFVHPDDAQRLRANNAALLRGEADPALRREHRFRLPNGDWIWMEGNPHLVRDGAGEIVEVVNIFRDVTHRRALEEVAEAQAEQFEAAFRHAAIGMALVGLDGSFLRINDAFCQIVGYSEDEMLALDFQTITHPDDLNADLEQLRQLTAGEIASYRLDKRYFRAGGEQVWVHLSVSIVRNAEGAPLHYVAQVQDLTERRAAEDALRASEARYRVLAEASEDVTIQLNAAGVITYASPAVRRYGYEPDDVVGVAMTDMLHPDDIDRALANLAAVTAGAAPSPENRTVRVRTRDGAWVWMEGNAQILRGARGRVSGFVTTLRNVTERREQEALFEAAFEQAALGKSIVAVGGQALRVNQVACRMLGYTQAELQALTTNELLHPDDIGKDAEAARELVEGKRQRYETIRRLRRSDGGYIWVRITVALVRYADGSPKHFVTEFEDLTERQAAQAALKVSEERYRLIAENTSDMIIMSDLRGRATYVSQAIRQAGRRPEDIEGRSFAESVHPDDLPRLVAAFQALLVDGKAERVRWRGRDMTNDGWSWLESNPSLVRDPVTGAPTGFLDVIRNVQLQVEQEEALAKAAAALQASEARYRVIGDNTSDIIVMAEPNGRISYISPSVSSIGYTPEELIGTAFIKQMHPEDLEKVWPSANGLPPGTTAPRMRWRAKHKITGEWVWLESQPTMLKDPATGGAAGFLDVVRDVSRQVEQEQALASARAEAEAAAAAKSQFLANMSHEIRTPLTAVLGFTSLLKELPELPAAASGYVDRIAGAGKGLLAIVNDILDFSKLEAGKFEVRPGPTDVAALAEETLMLFSNQAQEKALTLAFEAATDLPRAAMLDGDRLRQTLINLIGNAIKFTDAGRVGVTVARAGGEQIRVEVSDTGPGLDAEAQARLFQRFSQIDDSMTRRHGGTGLGLAICKGVAEAMGGTIGVTSTPGEGATFYVVLPAPAVETPQDLAGDDAPLSIEGVRVFLADDNATNRELARRILEAAGAEVQEAADGAEAVERLALLPVDVVLMDLRMPRLDGRGALARLRAEPGPNQRAPVLAFTADADLAGEGDLAGFDGLVRKPIQPLELYGAIAAAAQWPLEDEEVSYAAG